VDIAHQRGGRFSADVINLELERGLAKFKLPERIHYVPALPRNPMGKVVRTALQALLTTQEENC